MGSEEKQTPCTAAGKRPTNSSSKTLCFLHFSPVVALRIAKSNYTGSALNSSAEKGSTDVRVSQYPSQYWWVRGGDGGCSDWMSSLLGTRLCSNYSQKFSEVRKLRVQRLVPQAIPPFRCNCNSRCVARCWVWWALGNRIIQNPWAWWSYYQQNPLWRVIKIHSEKPPRTN